MRHREAVIDPDVSEARERRCKFGIVLFLAFVEARVLQADDVARLHRVDGRFGLLADAILNEGDRPLDDTRHFGGDGPQRSLGSGPFGRPRCDSRITLPPLSAISAMVGPMRSMRVTSETLPSSIGALRSTRSSTRLPFEVGLVEGAERGHRGTDASIRSAFPIATAVSIMRLEKPHSLSYHDSTAPSCRPSPWSDPWRTPTNASHG